MGNQGLRAVGGGPASPPYTNGPYTWDQQVTMTQGINGPIGQGTAFYVDGTNGAAGNNGKGWNTAMDTIQGAVDLASAGDTVYVVAKTITDYTGDPTSYSETVTIPFAKSSLSLIGVSRGRTQGGLPQMKVGTTTTLAILIIQAPGCLIMNMGINGAGATGGGILLDDDYAAKSAFGTSIINCHLKNCVGTDADDAKDGGAIQWTTAGNAWQVLISGCRFYKNVADITLMGTSNTRPQDVIIENCDMSGYAAYTDCNIYAGGSGFGSIVIDNCRFGQLPAIGANIARFYDLTGSLSGTVSNCTFGCDANAAATELTFGTAGTGGKTPATMNLVNCYGETTHISSEEVPWLSTA